ncbi:MAG: hypothetical protein KBH45_04015 [Verrucomicrobia bacterium]|nr:hypothetical protein [Verrucomicrobiota bacterium]
MKTKTLLVSAAAFLLAASALLADVREGLVAYWPMNTAPGSGSMTTPDVVAANDLQGPLKDGTTALVAGRHGNAVTFTGNTSDYLYLLPVGDTGLPVAKQGSWSYCVWVNGASGQVNQSTYFAETTSGTSTQWRFGMESDGTTKTRTIIRDTGGSLKVNAVLGNTNTLDSTWHHIAYTYDINAPSNQFRVYVDGECISTNTFTYGQNAASFNQIGVGALVRNTVAVPFTGAVDDLALWARALSQSEVQDVMNNSIATPIPAFAPTVTVNPKGATNLLEGDSFTLSGLCTGTRPFSYQWMKDGTNYPGPDANSLPLSNMTTNDNGLYQLVFNNTGGSATSTVAQVTVNAFGSPNLTNGIIAYYPCDTIVAGKSPELVAAYDMPLFGGMNATNIVAGKWGNALNFDKAVPQYGKKVFAPGDGLPGIRRTNVTYSVWVKNVPVSSFQLGEASSLEASTFHGFGGVGGSQLRMYIRNSGGSVYSDTYVSSVWDDTWHNVIYSQHDIGGGALAAQLYVDGALVATPATAIASLAPDSLGFCINPRSTLGSASGGGIDEVVYWNRVLSQAEIALVQTSYITNPPSLLPPLAITSFKADLAAVASGDSTMLRWDVPGNITSATISSGVGDVTARTTAAGGTTNIAVSVTNTTTYTLTITRGVETASKSVTIGAVKGVAAGWSLLDNFDFYKPGVLTTNGTWNAIATPDTLMVVQPTNQNHLAACYALDGNGSGGILNLQGLAVTAGQARTLFFRMTPQGTPAADVSHLIGITERVGTFMYTMFANNSGPLAYPRWDFANSAWWMGVSSGGSYSYDMTGLVTDAVYKVWIDVTNVPIVNVPGERVMPDEEDLFSVYIQKEGDPSRTALFENLPSDRLLNTIDDFTGTHYPDDIINKLYLMGASLTGEILFDDIYLSKTGILATTPIGAGYAGPAPTLQIQWSGSQWQVVFQGKLLEAPSVNGPWTDVTGATSPYPVTMTSGLKFYRAVSN